MSDASGSGQGSDRGAGAALEPPEDLLAAAKAAFRNAYIPYSGFGVGAALRAEDGEVYAGANVENASFGLTRCAEQSAVQAMATAGGRSFSQVVVYTESEEPSSPCGACRQVLHEFAPEAEVFLANHQGDVIRTTVRELLPGAFGPEKLPS
ncbi:MAG TPA: cytidine deaminase [Trueperaceae bacterium]